MLEFTQNPVVASKLTLGPWRIDQVTDCSLTSISTRVQDVAEVQKRLDQPLPQVGQCHGDAGQGLFWSAPFQWMRWAPYVDAPPTHDEFGELAYVTEQTDGWIRLDVQGADFSPILERLCNLDLAGFTPGSVQRTQIHHIGVFVLSLEDRLMIWVPRSMAHSLVHALTQAVENHLAQAALA